MLFVGWLSRDYKEHKGGSIYAPAHLLFEAQLYGFARHADESTPKSKIVCVFRPEFAPYYVRNLALLHEYAPPNPPNDDALPPSTKPVAFPRNLILYGAPGTGKSYLLEQRASEFITDKKRSVRVTFHSEYSYAQFVGSYRPSPLYRKADKHSLFKADKETPADFEPLIDYTYVPGPFLKMLVAAHHNPSENHLLIIEELNRANVASVFGEAFQMLDRDADGTGRFPVEFPPEAEAYLKSEYKPDEEIRIPKNFYIWATLNSADQGVQPLDAAFKRRWSFEYMPLNKYSSKVDGKKINLRRDETDRSVEWNHFRKVINKQLRKLHVAEDRLLGPFFLSSDELDNRDAFKNKVLMYLFEDIVRHDPSRSLFRHVSFGEIVQAFDSGEPIFEKEIEDEIFKPYNNDDSAA